MYLWDLYETGSLGVSNYTLITVFMKMLSLCLGEELLWGWILKKQQNRIKPIAVQVIDYNFNILNNVVVGNH